MKYLRATSTTYGASEPKQEKEGISIPPTSGSKSGVHSKKCIKGRDGGHNTPEAYTKRNTSLGRGEVPPTMSLAVQLKLSRTELPGAVDIKELASRFALAVTELGYSSSTVCHARKVAKMLGAAASNVLGRVPKTIDDLLREDVWVQLVSDIRSTGSADKKLPFVVRLAEYLHTGTITGRTAIPEVEWVRHLVRPARTVRPQRSYYEVSFDARFDHPLAQAFISYLNSLNRRWQKRAKYVCRDLCRWLCNESGDFSHSTPVTVDLDAVTERHLREYLRYVSGKKNGDKQLAPGTVRLYVQALRRWFAFLYLNRHISGNPASRLQSIDGGWEQAEWRIVSQDETERLFDAIVKYSRHPLRDIALYGCLAGLGLRPSEVLGLRIGDIDWVGVQLKVRGKGHKERIVPLPGPVLLAIERYLKSRKAVGSADGEPLWLNDRGTGPLSYAALQKRFALYKAIAGIRRPIGGPHVLRHFFVTETILSGADVEDVAAFVGHSNLRTLSRYLHMTDVGAKALLYKAFGAEIQEGGSQNGI